MRLISALRGAMAIAPVFAGQAAGQVPDPREIVRRAFDRPDNLFEGQRNFTYLKRSVIKQFDGSGQITKQEIETSEVMVLYGRPYSRLVARDDKPLSAEESRDEQAKMDKEMRKRKAEGNSRKRTEEDRGRQAGREVADAFHFRLVRMESTQAGEAYVIDATPRLDYEAKSRQAKMFRQMTARLWIERAGFRFVRGEARVIDTVSFGWFLFRLQPGAVFEIDQVMVDGVLLPRHVHVKGQARIAGLKVLRIEMEISFSDYKRFQVDSKVLAQ
jgi:hypothetical protein